MAGKVAKAASNVANLIGKYEIEIERLRDENKWLKLRELVTTIHNKDPRAGLEISFFSSFSVSVKQLNSSKNLFLKK